MSLSSKSREYVRLTFIRGSEKNTKAHNSEQAEQAARKWRIHQKLRLSLTCRLFNVHRSSTYLHASFYNRYQIYRKSIVLKNVISSFNIWFLRHETPWALHWHVLASWPNQGEIIFFRTSWLAKKRSSTERWSQGIRQFTWRFVKMARGFRIQTSWFWGMGENS